MGDLEVEGVTPAQAALEAMPVPLEVQGWVQLRAEQRHHTAAAILEVAQDLPVHPAPQVPLARLA